MTDNIPASTFPRLEQLALIGNCQAAALVSAARSVVWCCLPRFGSEPVFASLLDLQRGGRLLVGASDGRRGAAQYLPNTNVLRTEFQTEGGRFAVTDFFPRFELYG